MTKEISQPKTPKSSSPDSLTTASPSARVQLSETELDKVTGGETQNITVNKAKTADKAFNAMDAYIRG